MDPTVRRMFLGRRPVEQVLPGLLRLKETTSYSVDGPSHRALMNLDHAPAFTASDRLACPKVAKAAVDRSPTTRASKIHV